MLTCYFCVESVDSNKSGKASPCKRCSKIDLVRIAHTAHNASYQPRYEDSKLGHRFGFEMSRRTVSAGSHGPLHPRTLLLSKGVHLDRLDRVGYTVPVQSDH